VIFFSQLGNVLYSGYNTHTLFLLVKDPEKNYGIFIICVTTHKSMYHCRPPFVGVFLSVGVWDLILLYYLPCCARRVFFFEPNKCLVTYDWLFVVWPVDLFCTIRCSPLSLLLRFSRHLYLPFLFPLFIRERVHKKTVGKKFNTLYNV